MLKAVAKETWQLAGWLTHAANASRHDGTIIEAESFEFFPKSLPPTGQVRDIKGDQICLKDDACYLHEDRVHCFRMKNITLSADEHLIEQARLLAKSQHKTLNAMFREWLEQFTARSGGTQEFDALMKRLKHVQAGRRFSRDEMNER